MWEAGLRRLAWQAPLHSVVLLELARHGMLAALRIALGVAATASSCAPAGGAGQRKSSILGMAPRTAALATAVIAEHAALCFCAALFVSLYQVSCER